MVIEQRLFRRLPVPLQVDYVVPMRRGARFADRGCTVDLSAGGMLLALSPMPAVVLLELLEGPGDIEVTFGLDEGQARVSAPCRVVWVRRPMQSGESLRLGLRFVALDPAVAEAIHAFVVAHAP